MSDPTDEEIEELINKRAIKIPNEKLEKEWGNAKVKATEVTAELKAKATEVTAELKAKATEFTAELKAEFKAKASDFIAGLRPNQSALQKSDSNNNTTSSSTRDLQQSGEDDE